MKQEQTWYEYLWSWIITPRPSEAPRTPILHPALEEKIQMKTQMSKYDLVVKELKLVLQKRNDDVRNTTKCFS
jgi:hypothetical protein